jgi:hypothetical protein
MTPARLALSFAIVAALLAPLSARAQPRRPRGQVSVETTFFHRELDTFLGEDDVRFTVFSPLLDFWLRVRPHLSVDAAWGFGFGVVNPDGFYRDRGFHFGNPYVGLSYLAYTNGLVFRAGGGVALPLSSVTDDRDAGALGVAAGTLWTRGLWDLWLWDRAALSLVVTARIEGVHTSRLWLAAEASHAFLFYPEDNERSLDDDELEAMFQIGGEIGYDANGIIPGLGLQAVWLYTAQGDEAQAAMTLFLQFQWTRAFLRLALFMNLDDPLGFAFDDDGIYSIVVRLGTNLR